ncbi:hypothetical protein K449DRAFT_231619 [Hypoxylon sp. EC38]|nr:hypothetical protein K449DRAFT_231619 [Hypoxylon sp. EC38]
MPPRIDGNSPLSIRFSLSIIRFLSHIFACLHLFDHRKKYRMLEPQRGLTKKPPNILYRQQNPSVFCELFSDHRNIDDWTALENPCSLLFDVFLGTPTKWTLVYNMIHPTVSGSQSLTYQP